MESFVCNPLLPFKDVERLLPCFPQPAAEFKHHINSSVYSLTPDNLSLEHIILKSRNCPSNQHSLHFIQISVLSQVYKYGSPSRSGQGSLWSATLVQHSNQKKSPEGGENPMEKTKQNTVMNDLRKKAHMKKAYAEITTHRKEPMERSPYR